MRHGLKVVLGNREVRKNKRRQQRIQREREKEREPTQWNERGRDVEYHRSQKKETSKMK